MKWQGRRKSSNIDDRRGRSSGGMNFGSRAGGGLGALLTGPLLKMLFTKKGLIIAGIVVVISFAMGKNPLSLISQLMGGGQGFTSTTTQGPRSPEEDKMVEFCSTILASTEDVWNKLLGSEYREPTLVIFTGSVNSGCGSATSATGPFYCPGDEKLYLDLSFFEDMARKLNAPGDFAQAYVIAHEVGHHIQKIKGYTDMVHRQRGRISKKEYNRLSVRLELQADFYAGVWAHHSEKMMKIMERGDLQEALNAANAIGDDRLQKNATGRVVPDSFTHGTSEQRMRWFKKGFETGNFILGENTFSEDYRYL